MCVYHVSLQATLVHNTSLGQAKSIHGDQNMKYNVYAHLFFFPFPEIYKKVQFIEHASVLLSTKPCDLQGHVATGFSTLGLSNISWLHC